MKGKLVVVSGPSAGVGKDTLLKMFLDKHPEWIMPLSTTTRPLRAGELNGVHMSFIDHDAFEKLRNEGKFLEAVEVDNGQWYGTLKEPVEEALEQGKNVILRKDVRGAMLIKEKMPEAKLIFINAENTDALESRIRARGTEDEVSIKRRLKLAKQEITYQNRYDKVVINKTGETQQALADLTKAVSA